MRMTLIGLSLMLGVGCGDSSGGSGDSSTGGDGSGPGTGMTAPTGASMTGGMTLSTTGDGSTSSTTQPSTSSDGSGSSSTGADGNVDCEGPPPNDVCDEPRPYMGVGDCDPYAQDCPGGQKCMPWANDGGGAWNATRCSPLDPMPGALGDVCTVVGSGVSGEDDCDLGLMCWDVDPGTGMGICEELCGCGPVEPTCEGGGTLCVISGGGSLPICLGVCDPLDVAGTCSPGDLCVQGPGTDHFVCTPDASGDMGAPGDPCAFANVCDPGLVCGGPQDVPNCAAASCCTELCDLDEANTCSLAGQECRPFFSAATLPEACHADTGFCTVP